MFGDIRNSHGERLDYSFHQGEGDSKHIVVLGHGVTGNKDRPFVVALANGFADAGIHALRFSFSGNGDSEGRFIDSTISKEVEDLGSVLDALSDYSVCYAGHSMGGAVGVLRASEDSRIKSLVSLAGMVRTKIFARIEFGDVTPDEGFMWDNPDFPLSSAYMNDMTQIDSVVNRASRITVPWMILHGTDDDVVPVGESREIFASANKSAYLIEIGGADHVFSDESTSEMVMNVVAWVKMQFRKLDS